jgi:serine protease Do
MKRTLTYLLLPLLGLAAGRVATLPRPPDDFEHAFERVAESIRPSVVSITSTRRIRLRGLELPDELRDLDPRLPYLWPFFQGEEDERGNGTLRQQGMGSGVIVSADGFILTNHHVVAGSSQLEARLADGRELAARVVGTDPRSDLAVVRVEASGLAPVEFGDSDALKVGQWVAAFGSPFGLDQTMSCGIVSAKGRANLNITDFEDFLQTDAAINPGNSGGPLVDLGGKVVGINTAIVTRTGGYQGVGLAIPTAMARQILQRLMEDGRVVRGWLGVTIQEVTPELARSFGFSGTGGVLVADVSAGSPAAKAGLLAGDIVTALDGRPVEGVTRFRNRIADARPGTRASLSVWRKDRSLELGVQLAAAPDGSAPAAVEAEASTGFGLELADLTPALRRELALAEDLRGALVERVAPESSAEEAGLEAGDVIVQIDGTPVDDAAQTVEALRARGSTGAALRVARGGTMHWIHLAAAEGKR